MTNHDILSLELSNLSLHLRWPRLSQKLQWEYRESKVVERAWVAVTAPWVEGLLCGGVGVVVGVEAAKYKILNT